MRPSWHELAKRLATPLVPTLNPERPVALSLYLVVTAGWARVLGELSPLLVVIMAGICSAGVFRVMRDAHAQLKLYCSKS